MEGSAAETLGAGSYENARLDPGEKCKIRSRVYTELDKERERGPRNEIKQDRKKKKFKLILRIAKLTILLGKKVQEHCGS